MNQKLIEFLQNYWLLFVILNPILTLVITPIIVAIINKKTINLSSADDIIKLKDYNENKKIEKRQYNLKLKLYRNCFQKQKKYKGWILWDFNEMGNIENRWFRVINKDGEYLTLKFPEHIIVRRYGYDPKDRLQHGHYFLKPNFIEIILNNLKIFYSRRITEKNIPCLIKYLEEKKVNNKKIEINEIFSYFKNIKFYLLEKMLKDLNCERKDLTNLIVIRQIGTDNLIPYFNDIDKQNNGI